MLAIIDISEDDYDLMHKAFAESSFCKASDSAFSVGSIVTTMNREIVSTGYSREFGRDWHAEEVAIEKACRGITSLDNCILYSTLEPCGERSSRPVSCSQLILNKNIPIVIFAEREPDSFVAAPKGILQLAANGVQVFKLDGFKCQFEQYNNHIR
jgi:diaminohydroxyphosphoribosylaminopyrimidine deaminase/5-amino-6-(5-phosphoribosylamino)uracil reductase